MLTPSRQIRSFGVPTASLASGTGKTFSLDIHASELREPIFVNQDFRTRTGVGEVQKKPLSLSLFHMSPPVPPRSEVTKIDARIAHILDSGKREGRKTVLAPGT